MREVAGLVAWMIALQASAALGMTTGELRASDHALRAAIAATAPTRHGARAFAFMSTAHQFQNEQSPKSLALQGQTRASLVSALRHGADPSHVALVVVSEIVDPIQTERRPRSATDIGEEVRVALQPPIADGDTAPAEILIPFAAGVVAAAFHFLPRQIFWGSLVSAGFAMSANPVAQLLLPNATATARFAAHQLWRRDQFARRSAIALTPHVAARALAGRVIGDDQAAEAAANQEKPCRHEGDCMTGYGGALSKFSRPDGSRL